VTTRVRALLVPVGSDLYAIDADHVREVVTVPLVTRLPTVPDSVLGLYNLRGEIIPMFDTAALLGIGRIPSLSFAIIVSTRLGSAGMAVTALPQVASLEELVGSSELPSTLGTYADGERLVVLLDVDDLICTRAQSVAATRRSA
jgi:purine-binding chemotaxis protein CheW